MWSTVTVKERGDGNAHECCGGGATGAIRWRIEVAGAAAAAALPGRRGAGRRTAHCLVGVVNTTAVVLSATAMQYLK